VDRILATLGPGRALGVITLAPSAIAALLDAGHERHPAALEALGRTGLLPTVVPAATLAEVDRLLARRLDSAATPMFLAGLERGETLLDCGDLDVPRIRELLLRFADVPLRLPDAAVIACAERNGGAVLSFDRRALRVAARELPIRIFP